MKITRTNAHLEYRSRVEDFVGLDSEDKHILVNEGMEGHHAELFKEQDIERRAWTRHGGQKGFISYLKGLYRKHAIRKAKKGTNTTMKPFRLPRGYHRDVLGVSPPPLPSAPSQQFNPSGPEEEAPGMLPSATRIKSLMPPWLWDNCTSHLNQLDGWLQRKGRKALSAQQRESAMDSALEFAKNYPARDPPGPVQSPWVVALRRTLEDAPSRPHGYAPGQPLDGVVFLGKSEEVNIYLFQWDDVYLRRLFAALQAAIRCNGWDHAGWLSLRWEVYDKFMHCVGPKILYDPSRQRWHDSGRQWLVRDFVEAGLRQHCIGDTASSTAANCRTVLSPTRSSQGKSAM
ncbi:hypothetical protein C8Q77DRAFT_1064861 [Trametes polyzona]|nr:hypothetical protein C8Q77DRAFT_1064861 [Trametes polyzona]